MNYLTGLCAIVLLCAMARANEPMLEWTLKYMEREIPEGSKESLEDASDYRKHKKDFKEKLSLASYTCGFTASAAKASLGSKSIVLVLLPTARGKIRIYGDYGPSDNKQIIISTIDPIKEIRYGEEIDLGGSGGGIRDKKTGRRIGTVVGEFVLVIKKIDGDFSKLIENAGKKRFGTEWH